MASIDLRFASAPNDPASPVRLVFGADDAPPEYTLRARGRLAGLRGAVALRDPRGVALVFDQPANPPGSPVRIVFGDTGAPPVAESAATLAAAGRITGLAGALRLHTLARLRAGGRITALRGSIAARYDINVERPLVGGARARWQDAATLGATTRGGWQQSAPLAAATRGRWQDAAALQAALRGAWQQSLPLALVRRLRDQQAAALERGLRARFESAEHLQHGNRQRWQDGASLRATARSRFEQALQLLRSARAGFEQGKPIAAGVADAFRSGVTLQLTSRQRWQDAWPPRPGRTPGPPRPPEHEPCYDPSLPVRLVFDALADNLLPLRLVFACERKGGPPPVDPALPRFLIPLLGAYVSLHTAAAVTLPGLEPVQLLGLTISADDDGFGWSLAATGPEHLLDQLAPRQGLPARVRVTVDDIDWVFAVERLARTRRFGESRVQLQGRSVTALLGDPYLPAQTWLSAADLTAQQIVADALQYTGVTLDWQIPDWLVPPGAWSFQGTPLAAALRVAEAAGGVVRSHRTQERLVLAPRYPVLPWAWPAATPALRMPAAVIVTDELQPASRPDYNAVFVSGTSQGINGHVIRTGTAGDVLAPQVTDALITHVDAARARGAMVLAAGGRKLTQTLSLPLLTGGTSPGLVEPGWLIEVADTDATWRGLVRGVSVTAALPSVRQQITVERQA